MTFQRIVQTFSLAFFLWLLWHATFPLSPIWPVDAYLKLDPLNAFGVSISNRMYLTALILATLMVGFTLLIGRFFCGFLCPFGITVDVTDRLLCRNMLKTPFNFPHAKSSSDGRWIKYAILIFLFCAALFGVSFLFLVSPICLITQFYGLVLTPVLNLMVDYSLDVFQPLADYFDVSVLAYLEVPTPQYQYHWFVALIFVAVFWGSQLAPRFWCRYVCPSGALFALVSKRPIIRRHVSNECTRCGICQKQCPMSAIEEDPFVTNHGECITCSTCVRVCPAKAVTFRVPAPKIATHSAFSSHRRKLITAGLFGMGAAVITHTGLSRVEGSITPGTASPRDLLRPPGSIPEVDFLATCIRCGMCMKACPTNTLQPYGWDAGLSAFFSPVLKPKRGPCEPLCNVCGQVCPTKAIRRLPIAEKLWAKIGTAYILRHKCLAWEFDKKCLVCDEVCPYDAISLKRVQGISQAVPFVAENRCSGCGYCEHHCPVQNQSAIIIEPMDAVRLSAGNYIAHGKQRGLSLNVKAKPNPVNPSPNPSQGLPPGFSN